MASLDRRTYAYCLAHIYLNQENAVAKSPLASTYMRVVHRILLSPENLKPRHVALIYPLIFQMVQCRSGDLARPFASGNINPDCSNPKW